MNHHLGEQTLELICCCTLRPLASVPATTRYLGGLCRPEQRNGVGLDGGIARPQRSATVDCSRLVLVATDAKQASLRAVASLNIWARCEFARAAFFARGAKRSEPRRVLRRKFFDVRFRCAFSL
jgi:hypothetical protein